MPKKSIWEFIQKKHEEFPRERYEEIRERAERPEESGFNPAMEDMAQLKLRFHEYLEEHPESYAPSFTALYKQYLFEYLREHIEIHEEEVQVVTLVKAVDTVLTEVEDTDLERMQSPFEGITDMIRPYSLRYGLDDAERWDDVTNALSELESLDDFAAIRTVWSSMDV